MNPAHKLVIGSLIVLAALIGWIEFNPTTTTNKSDVPTQSETLPNGQFSEAGTFTIEASTGNKLYFMPNSEKSIWKFSNESEAIALLKINSAGQLGKNNCGTITGEAQIIYANRVDSIPNTKDLQTSSVKLVSVKNTIQPAYCTSIESIIETATEKGTGDYSNQEFGISFDYDKSVYKAPVAEKDDNGNIQLRMQDATSPTPMPEAPFVLISKVPGYQNYIDERVTELMKNQYVKIINRNKVDGNPAVKYSEDAMGVPVSVLIKHPLGFHLLITGNFPGPAFDKLIQSIQILK